MREINKDEYKIVKYILRPSFQNPYCNDIEYINLIPRKANIIMEVKSKLSK